MHCNNSETAGDCARDIKIYATSRYLSCKWHDARDLPFITNNYWLWAHCRTLLSRQNASDPCAYKPYQTDVDWLQRLQFSRFLEHIMVKLYQAVVKKTCNIRRTVFSIHYTIPCEEKIITYACHWIRQTDGKALLFVLRNVHRVRVWRMDRQGHILVTADFNIKKINWHTLPDIRLKWNQLPRTVASFAF